MIYTFLISIVFIAEIIIAVTIAQNLIKLNKKILELDEDLTKIKFSIKDISILMRKISIQIKILAENFVQKTKENSESFFLKQLSKIFISMLLLKFNFNLIKKLQKSKFTKIFAKTWLILESMV